jgi:hypothetical protein
MGTTRWVAHNFDPSNIDPYHEPFGRSHCFLYLKAPFSKSMSAMTDWENLPYPHPRQLPNEDDIRYGKTVIGQLDRSIEDIKQNIRRLQTQLQEVQQKRANHLSYLAPLRCLPTEILSEIVTIYLEDGEDILAVAGICSRLREVVLGMTAVWSHITLRRQGHYGSYSKVSSCLFSFVWF